MEIRFPEYYVSFQCLAGACPHTCCGGWEVPVDKATEALYRSLPGELGERAREALGTGEDGDVVLRLRRGHCPLLEPDGLCRIHKELGEAATSLTCRSHPRFRYVYGGLEERGLCGSCPEAARLILSSDTALTSSQEEGAEEEAPPLLTVLLEARETAMALLGTEIPLEDRLRGVLLFANEVQLLLDQGREGDIPGLCRVYEEGFPLVEPDGLPEGEEALGKCFDLLLGLDILQEEWRKLLLSGQKEGGSPDPILGARATGYFLYRHWLRGVWDRDVLSWAEFAVLGTITAGRLAPLQEEGFAGAFRLFCLELEHHEGNMGAIQDGLWDQISLAEMLGAAEI